MDPALDVSSPFRNESKASEGNCDHAIEQITNDDVPLMYWGTEAFDSAGVAAAADGSEGARGERQTVCSMCGERHTTARVPRDGLYRCSACMAEQAVQGRPRKFPEGTFRCCPTATEEGQGGVVRCTACGGWYHLRCVGLASEGDDDLLVQYVTLSTTRWYCPEPICCEKVLLKQLKKRK